MVQMRTARIFTALAFMGSLVLLAGTGAQAETRRAFVLGIQRYDDPDIQNLTRADNDAADIAADLQEVGFDKKNITLATDVRTRDEFDKKFQAFLKTVDEGDDVFFFFSGHGTGIEATNKNYLLLGSLKSLKTYTRARLLDADRRDDIIALKMPAFESQYDADEIPKDGVSVADIIHAIAGRKPAAAFVVLDACRSLPPATADIRTLKRSATSGSRLLPNDDLPAGFLTLYSASYGETAIESFGRPTSAETRFSPRFCARRCSGPAKPCRNWRSAHGWSCVPTRRRAASSRIQNISTISRRRMISPLSALSVPTLPAAQQQCEGAQQDWEQISQQPARETLERHRRRFQDCPTAELARRALVDLISSPVGSSFTATPLDRNIDDCDRLAAADIDNARPPEVPGVSLGKLDFDAAIPACQKSIARNPRLARFLYDYGRAQQAAANSMRPGRSGAPADAAGGVCGVQGCCRSRLYRGALQSGDGLRLRGGPQSGPGSGSGEQGSDQGGRPGLSRGHV